MEAGKARALIVAMTATAAVFAFSVPSNAWEPDPPNSLNGADHIFACGEDEPPSGTYLDINQTPYGTYFYDCTEGTVTETGTSSDACAKVTGGPYRQIPLHGICIIVNDVRGDTLSFEPFNVQVHMFIAIYGSWNMDRGNYYAHFEGGQYDGEIVFNCPPGYFWQSCPPDEGSACYGSIPVLNAYINYCSKLHQTDFPGCWLPYDYESVAGHLFIESVAEEYLHDRSAIKCYGNP